MHELSSLFYKMCTLAHLRRLLFRVVLIHVSYLFGICIVFWYVKQVLSFRKKKKSVRCLDLGYFMFATKFCEFIHNISKMQVNPQVKMELSSTLLQIV